MKQRWFFNILVLSVMGYFLVSAMGNLLTARHEPGMPSALVPAEAGPNREISLRPLEDYGIITERNLFGLAKEEASAAQEEVSLEGLPVSLKVLGFKLFGTVVADDSAENLAILDNQSARKQELYHEGDQVGEALVKKILRNKVVLSTDKGDEVLTMEFEETVGRTNDSRPSQGSDAGQVPGAGSSDNPPEPEGVSSPLADLDEIIQQVQLSPYPPGEQPAGVRVTGPPKALARLRLRNGDMITGVNGESITDPAQARELFDRVAQGEEVTVDIMRRNRPRKIRLQ